MRITNVMVRNTMLGNINRNQHSLNRLMNQMATQRLISNPSENPLIATRALRFENTRNQITQHQRNVTQAQAWTEVTEQAVSDLVNVMHRIEELLNRADGIETLEDQQIFATEIEALLEEKMTIMNKQFAGRYIFSGLRTDEPPFFTRDMPNLTFTDITTSFGREDMETTIVLDRSNGAVAPNTSAEPFTRRIHTMKLPHGADPGSVRINGQVVGTIPMMPAPNENEIDYSAMTPGAVYHNPATGELIALADDAPAQPATEAANPFLVELDGPLGGVGRLEVQYDQTGFVRGDMNPKVFFTVTDEDGVIFNQDNQRMEFEFGIATRINVNLLARDLVTSNMFADIRNFANGINNLEPTSSARAREILGQQLGVLPDDVPDEDVRRFLNDERAMIDSVIGDRFNNMIGRMTGYQDSVSSQQTELGTRMVRIDMIADRLTSDNLTFEELQTNNIGTDMAEATSRFMTAEVALTAALQIGMHNIMNMSLLNFM